MQYRYPYCIGAESSNAQYGVNILFITVFVVAVTLEALIVLLDYFNLVQQIWIC